MWTKTLKLGLVAMAIGGTFMAGICVGLFLGLNERIAGDAMTIDRLNKEISVLEDAAEQD